jgi:hypothetical protein
MSIKRRDQEFRFPKVSYIDYKQIEMDRVLTMLFPRVKYRGYGSRRKTRRDLKLEDFISTFQQHDEAIVGGARQIQGNPDWHIAFQQSGHIDPAWLPGLNERQLELVVELLQEARRGGQSLDIWFRGLWKDDTAGRILERWIETDLMDVVNRGRPGQAIAAPRPLHGNTYKFRNIRHSRDYNAGEQVFNMLYAARGTRGQLAIQALYDFFFTGIDRATDGYLATAGLDVETQALLRIDQQIQHDIADTTNEPQRYPPLCPAHADILAEDVLRLMAYQHSVPRSVLVEYLKILTAFHLALYHLKILKMLPALVRAKGDDGACGQHGCPAASGDTMLGTSCNYATALVVDMVGTGNEHMRELARRSADAHYRRIPDYIHAQFVVKKLDEMADYMITKMQRMTRPERGYLTVGELAGLLQPEHEAMVESYFQGRMVTLMDDVSDNNGQVDPEVTAITGLQLGSFDTFIEILVMLRSRFHGDYMTQCLDSLLLKNSDACLLRQARVRKSPRAFSMGSRLLEVLLQLAVLVPKGSGYTTRELSVDALLDWLRQRYGLYIDRLPSDDGFMEASILDRQALRANIEAFKNRLREIGFFEDLSDAYLTQTVRSRYQIESK